MFKIIFPLLILADCSLAQNARKLCCPEAKQGSNAAYDAKYVEGAVTFALDYAIGEDKFAIHGPVNVAVFNSSGLEWIKKPTCGEKSANKKLPQKSSTHKAPAP